VKRGDTLGAIAAKHGTTIRVLMELNHLQRPDPLYIDRKLVLPTPVRTYRVKKGDTLSEIAARHETTIRVLMELNHLQRPDPLYIDRKLVLPTPSATQNYPE